MAAFITRLEKYTLYNNIRIKLSFHKMFFERGSFTMIGEFGFFFFFTYDQLKRNDQIIAELK